MSSARVTTPLSLLSAVRPSIIPSPSLPSFPILVVSREKERVFPFPPPPAFEISAFTTFPRKAKERSTSSMSNFPLLRLLPSLSFFLTSRFSAHSKREKFECSYSGAERLIVRLSARRGKNETEKEWGRERKRVRVSERESGATKAAQPLWTFVSITHRLGEVSPRCRTPVILSQILSR